MSAAATAAGYLYASGRLRGRGQREDQHDESAHGEKAAPAKDERRPKVAALRNDVRVAALPSESEPAAISRPRRQPTIQYRTRRWRPGANGE